MTTFEFRIDDGFGGSHTVPIAADSEEEALQSVDFHYPYASDIRLIAVRGRRLRSLEAFDYDE